MWREAYAKSNCLYNKGWTNKRTKKKNKCVAISYRLGTNKNLKFICIAIIDNLSRIEKTFALPSFPKYPLQ